MIVPMLRVGKWPDSLIVPTLRRGNAAPDALRPSRAHAQPRSRLASSAFRLDGESGEMHGHFPRHPLGHPNCTALRVRCVARSGGDARKLGATHLRHRAHLFPASPALLARADGEFGPCIL